MTTLNEELGPMRNLIWVSLGVFVLLMSPGAGRAQESPAGVTEPPQGIDQWIEALESDTYTARVRATEQLIMAGSPSIEPIVRAVDQGGLETISRGIYVLRQLAVAGPDPASEEQAYRALHTLSERRFSGAARRAATALQTIHVMRQQRAQQQLTQLGAVFSMTQVQVALGMRNGYPSIQFGSTWRGSPADFAQVAWITAFPAEQSEEKWMIVIEGQRVTDEWMDHIAAIENVAVLKFKSSELSDEAVAKLAAMQNLEILEVLYCSLTDVAVEHLAGLPKIARLRLIGTRMTADGIERLQQAIAQADIDYRTGGFLGISCSDNPCRITLVQPNSAAAVAGFRVDDVISRYNGQPVQTMDELARLISQHTVGDRVPVELLRNNERIVQEVELGAWD